MVAAATPLEAVKYEAVATAILDGCPSIIVNAYDGDSCATVASYDSDGIRRSHVLNLRSRSQSGHRQAVSIARDEEANKRHSLSNNFPNRSCLRASKLHPCSVRLAGSAHISAATDTSRTQFQVPAATGLAIREVLVGSGSGRPKSHCESASAFRIWA